MSDVEKKLKDRIRMQARRMKQAERDRSTLLAQTMYMGTLGILMIVPIVVGAYVGLWLDGLAEGYSIRWTISLILLGAVIGAVNIYFFVKE